MNEVSTKKCAKYFGQYIFRIVNETALNIDDFRCGVHRGCLKVSFSIDVGAGLICLEEAARRQERSMFRVPLSDKVELLV